MLCTGLLGACGGSGSPSVVSKTDPRLQSYSTAQSTSIGGSVQKGALSPGKFSNYSVSTVWGVTNSPGFRNYSNGNGGKELFNHPTDITTADGTDFYVVDYLNYLVRKITKSAGGDVVTTLPLAGLNYPTGITIYGTKLYIVNSGSNTILAYDLTTQKVVTIGSPLGLPGYVDSTDPTLALFNRPIGITTDGFHLYVTDYNNATIRSIDMNNFAVYTHAGSPLLPGNADGTQTDARFSLPGYITTDGKDLYVTDIYNRTIRKVGIRDGIVTTIAGASGQVGPDFGALDGKGTAARFNQPKGITTDGTYLYVSDSYLNLIRRINIIDLGDGLYNVTTIAGTLTVDGDGHSIDSQPGPASFDAPLGLTTDGTSLYVCDTGSNTIRMVK